MAVKKSVVPGIGEVSLYKRRDAKHIRISIKQDGTVRVTLPSWAPYRAGIEFVNRKSEWIASRKFRPDELTDGARIGKAHTLRFIEKSDISKPSTRLVGTDIRVMLPKGMSEVEESGQTAAKSACIRALKKEAGNLLPQRVAYLAAENGFEYSSVSIKQLRSRWGSCSSKKDIVLNCYLMQLPWRLIDYVIMHELSHTIHMSHGSSFWELLRSRLPDLEVLRKEIKSYNPLLIDLNRHRS